MLLLAAFAVTLSVALAVPADGMASTMATTSMPTNAPQTICCVPTKWQANMVDLKEKNRLTHTTMLAVDEINQLEGLYVVPMGAQMPNYQELFDYKNMMKYHVDMTSGDPTKYKCVQEKLTRPFIGGCTDKNLTITNMNYIGESTVGPMNKAIKFDVWSFTVPNNDLDIIIGLSRDGCIPLLENVKNSPGSSVQFEMLYMFNDVTTTLTNPELLTMPAACVGGSVVG